MLRLLARLEVLPRRLLYVALFVLVGIPFVFPVHLPLYVWKETRNAFNVTQSTPPDKVVAICSNWVAGSQGENWPQYEALVAHCMVADIKFVVFAIDADPVAPQMAEDINRRQAKRYGKVYGKDWVNLGLSRGAPLVMGAIGRNVKGVYQQDFQHISTRDYDRLPLMKQVRDVRDFGCVWVIDYTPSLDWLVFLDPTQRTPILFACAGITSSTYYPFVASGQIRGVMVGTRGGAEYEELLRQKFGKRFDDTGMRGQKMLVPLAFGNVVVILFIVAGNVGMFASRRLSGGKR